MATNSNGPRHQSETVSQGLHDLFEYSPSILIADPRRSVKTDVPFWLYDKHLDSRLNLLHVKSLSALPESLAAVADAAVESLADRGIQLPETGRSFPGNARCQGRQLQVTNANSVASYYSDTTALSCVTFASMLGIHPRAPSWMTALDWGMFPDWSHSWAWEDEFSLRIKYDRRKKAFYFPDELVQFLDVQTLKDLENAAKRLPALATWVIGPVSRKTEDVLRDMDKFIAMNEFKSKIPSTTGLPPLTTRVFAESPDATLTPWEVGERYFESRSPHECASSEKRPRRSARLRNARLGQKIPDARKRPTASSTCQHSFGPQKATTTTPNDEFVICPGAEAIPLSEAGRLLQHAWATSVQKDTSLIIFHCGNFERIGIRHRKSQTLYLSDLIDVPNIRNPSYGKLHLGLHMAAFNDTLDRAAQLRELENMPISRGLTPTDLRRPKRKAEDNLWSANKRSQQKEGTPNAPPHDFNCVFREAGLRDLALLQFQYGIYNSTSPSSFLRVRNSLWPHTKGSYSPRLHRKYLPNEYFRIILSSLIGDGSTGIVHSAMLELKTHDHRSMTCDVVVKFAFTAEQQRRLRNEYSIYGHLSASGVTGVIVGVLGLFEDIEGGPLALIMSHGGISLDDRGEQPNTVEERMSERAAFLHAVKSIHNTGIQHNDLRTPNLLVNGSGGVTVLDFDMANFHASESARRGERAALGVLLDEIYGLESDATSETGTSTTSSYENSRAESVETVGDEI
ncbi:hypothetical protein Hypma_003536 [Hypsizygus marmoreus]|uniref:Protein kinase domain-containing protein n=1 Tax=Hypsizygus marmoreus TaxID=39966 RepID=A0A369J1W1_HYPMA|nr:hypothetical protein Hypma_003536 [Hypsizygus marmoreus]